MCKLRFRSNKEKNTIFCSLDFNGIWGFVYVKARRKGVDVHKYGWQLNILGQKAKVTMFTSLKGAAELWEVLWSVRTPLRVIGKLDSDWQESMATTQPICQVQ